MVVFSSYLCLLCKLFLTNGQFQMAKWMFFNTHGAFHAVAILIDGNNTALILEYDLLASSKNSARFDS